MINERQVKEGIQQLIDDFKTNEQEYRKDSEASIETKLIEPLFFLLGWTKNDFNKQAKAHRGEKAGHADYVFKIGDKIAFFLEVKRVGVPLDKEADAHCFVCVIIWNSSYCDLYEFRGIKSILC